MYLQLSKREKASPVKSEELNSRKIIFQFIRCDAFTISTFFYFLNFSFVIWRFLSSRLVIVMLPENTFLKNWTPNLAFFENKWGENRSNGLFSTSRLVLLFRRRARYSLSIDVVNQRNAPYSQLKNLWLTYFECKTWPRTINVKTEIA